MSKVLIVDDSQTNLTLLSQLAHRVDDNLNITALDHAQKALTWLQSNTPDLVIVDYNMPDIDGIEFTRKCRNTSNADDVPIVMVTAARRRKVCLDALHAGATEFLNSPVKEDDFIARIGHLLQLRRTTQSLRLRNINLKKTRGHFKRLALKHSAVGWSKIALVLDSVPVMLSAVSTEGHCLFINALLAAYFECDPKDIIGKHISTLPEHIRNHMMQYVSSEHADMTPQRGAKEYEDVHTDTNGMRRVLLTTTQPIADETNNVVAILTASIDITARKQAEDHLVHAAEHDSLTELPNRLSLRRHIERSTKQSSADQTSFAILFLDIDRFKDINDTLGHEFGDRLLYAIASRLDQTISVPNFVARLGGDEFAIILTNTCDADAATNYAQIICDTLCEPIFIGNHEVRVSASIGIASYPADGTTVDQLLSRADLAMYRAKSQGGNGYSSACAQDHQRACRNALLESDLRNAIAHDQLRLYYQPKICLTQRKLIGAEALIRWQHPEFGLFAPDEFLPLAEQCGLILPIGEWVVHTACKDASWWTQNGHPEVSVSVNISPIQFARQSISELARDAISRTALDPSKLVVELTEQSIMRNTPALQTDLENLQALGSKLSLDDFGTGYASLRYVQQLPISELKIDRSFVKNHTVDRNDFAIINAIIGLGKSLNLDVIAEGVETIADVISLKNAGCHAAQGYYFSPPVPFREFQTLLQSEHELCGDLRDHCA